MTEEEIRKIVRDEIEAAAVEVGGLYDQMRETSFGMTRTIIEAVANIVIASFDPKRGGGAELAALDPGSDGGSRKS